MSDATGHMVDNSLPLITTGNVDGSTPIRIDPAIMVENNAEHLLEKAFGERPNLHNWLQLSLRQ